MHRIACWFTSLKASEWLGLYGAILSTILAIAKGWSYIVGPRSIVKVRLGLGEVASFGAGRVAKRESSYLATVMNRSTHAITVTGLELVPQVSPADGTKSWLLPSPAVGVTLPFDVPPRSSKNLQLPAAELPEQYGGLRRVAVHLATGERVASNRVRQRSVPRK